MCFERDKFTVGLVGGDARISILTSLMKKAGYKVFCYSIADCGGLEPSEICFSIEELISACDIIVLPVPVSRDKVHLFSEKSCAPLPLKHLIFDAKDYGQKVFFGGAFGNDFRRSLEEKGHTVIDVLNDSELVLKNAIATAEGALMIAMEKTEFTIKDRDFCILGYGRIASHLVKIIGAMGGNVTVLARSDNALMEAVLHGFKSIKLDQNNVQNIAMSLDGASVIFNTVPSNIITKEIIENMRNRPLYVELASHPYGIDIKLARELDFNTVFAPSLPGKYAPVSAAEYIFEAIEKSLEEIYC